MRKLVLLALLVASAAAQTFYRLPAPYTYSCRGSMCIKEDRNEAKEFRSMETCQLTCGKYGSLWPKPTGDTNIGSTTVSFSPKNVQVTKLAATNPKVTGMLEEAVNYFTRNLHFLHPDYPKEQKKPVTQEEKYGLNEPSVDAYQVIQQQRLRTEQITGETIQQQQQQEFRRPFSTINEKTERFFKYSPFITERSTPIAENHVLNLDITVTSPEDKLTLDTDESYTLVVQTSRQETTATIVATTYYGARHGLESLSQLIAYDDNNNALQIVSNAKVQDKPAFKYRGIMLDTGRNFYPKEDIMQLLDAMSYNKMNYFHWHISDSASFPMYSSRRPEMAYYGAYSPREVYYPEDITQIVEYAKLRGIKVIPELDGPAHTNAGWQWGEKEGMGKLVLCTNQEPWFEVGKEPPSGQVNPTNPQVYTVLEELYRDMMDYFDPEMVHMGGDGVSFKCWQNSPEIQEYLASKGREPVSQEFFELWNTYQQNAYAKLREASGPYRKVTPIIHASSYALNYADKDSYIVQLNMEANNAEIPKYINQGFKVIFSNQDQWRLDCSGENFYGEKAEGCKGSIPSWRNVYENSPLDMLENLGVSNARSGQFRSTQQQQAIPIKDQVLGGEASLWSFDTDANGFQSKVWPRVSALAERLWTDPVPSVQQGAEIDTSTKRFNIHRQRMVHLGVRADPVQPKFCMQNEQACYSREQYLARADTTQITV